MSIYNETIDILKAEDIVKELYRFQGGRSNECFNFTTSKFIEVPNKEYVYFSKSLDHHKYFMVKRIKQILKESILLESGFRVNNKDLGNQEKYNQIKTIVLNTELLPKLSSIRLICDTSYTGLIKENCINNHKKTEKGLIERVDRRVHGGGYGVANEWKELLVYLTYFSASQKIERKDIIKLLSNMKKTGRINRKDNIEFVTSNIEAYNFRLNPTLESDFTKYKIMECLESIIDKELLLSTSELAKHPTATIKKVVGDYEKNKSKILTIFEKHTKM